MRKGRIRRGALPVERVEESSYAPAGRGAWPTNLAPVRQLLDEGLDLGPVTVFTGENGVGKSTLVEAIAGAYGMNPEGGSTGAMHLTHATESPLNDHLFLRRGPGSARRGFFLRAETMHGFYTYLEDEVRFPEEPGVRALHERSHGESFLRLVEERWFLQGLWVLDEPESALSLSGCLALISLLREQIEKGSQVILSTHSPILAAFPDADLYELGEWGIRRSAYDDLDLVRAWRLFLGAPDRFLRHLD